MTQSKSAVYEAPGSRVFKLSAAYDMLPVNVILPSDKEQTALTVSFRYDKTYLEMENAVAVSLTLPMREEPYESKVLFPFFDGLIPEGWLLEVVTRNWKISYKDRFGLLLIACRDCIGDVAVEAADHGDSESAN